MTPGLFVIQLLHPGGEATGRVGNRVPWNSGPRHSRKFLMQPGRYLRTARSKPSSADLSFWGEWEPPSEIVAAPNSSGGLPEAVHRPLFERPAPYAGLQNTDPFVFGRFLYATCLQHRETGPTQLAALVPGSLVLFGSGKGHQFILDTVFVVKKRVPHSVQTYQDAARQLLPDRLAEAYTDITLRAVYGGSGCGEARKRQQCLYLGASHDDRYEGMFSFFPCLPVRGEHVGFARPAVQLPDIVTGNMTQSFKKTPCETTQDVVNIWKQVVDQVIDCDLCLGVEAALPGGGTSRT